MQQVSRLRWLPSSYHRVTRDNQIQLVSYMDNQWALAIRRKQRQFGVIFLINATHTMYPTHIHFELYWGLSVRASIESSNSKAMQSSLFSGKLSSVLNKRLFFLKMASTTLHCTAGNAPCLHTIKCNCIGLNLGFGNKQMGLEVQKRLR